MFFLALPFPVIFPSCTAILHPLSCDCPCYHSIQTEGMLLSQQDYFIASPSCWKGHVRSVFFTVPYDKASANKMLADIKETGQKSIVCHHQPEMGVGRQQW